mgnify:CR=1 FL=1
MTIFHNITHHGVIGTVPDFEPNDQGSITGRDRNFNSTFGAMCVCMCVCVCVCVYCPVLSPAEALRSADRRYRRLVLVSLSSVVVK